MSRTVTQCNAELSVIEPVESVDLRNWTEEQCAKENYSWLLAHLLGGVVWGIFQNGSLKMKETKFVDGQKGFPDTDSLSVANILQLRLFSKNQELFCWKDSENKLKGRVIKENASGSSTRWHICIDEEHVLWGTEYEKQADDFLLLTERGRELQQTIPSIAARAGKQRLHLKVRQYLEACPSSGQLIERCGRLVELVGG